MTTIPPRPEEGRGRMLAQWTDEQIAEEIVRDVSYRPDRAWLGPAIVAALTRAREAGAEAMRKRAAKTCDESAAEAERLRNLVPANSTDAEDVRKRISRTSWVNTSQSLAAEIRALPLTEVIPDGK